MCNTCLFVTVLAFRSVVPPPVLEFRQLSIFYEREDGQIDSIPVIKKITDETQFF